MDELIGVLAFQIINEVTMLALMAKLDGKDKWGVLPDVGAVSRKTGKALVDARPVAADPNFLPAVNVNGLETEGLTFDIEKAFCHQLVQMSRVNGWEKVDLREKYWLEQ